MSTDGLHYNIGTPDAVPPCDQTLPSLGEAGEELVRAFECALIEQVLSRAKVREDALERRIAALEKKSQEVLRHPGTSQSGSPSKEGGFILAAPIKGVGEDGRLILGDQRILSANALKI